MLRDLLGRSLGFKEEREATGHDSDVNWLTCDLCVGDCDLDQQDPGTHRSFGRRRGRGCGGKERDRSEGQSCVTDS